MLNIRAVIVIKQCETSVYLYDIIMLSVQHLAYKVTLCKYVLSY